MRLLSHNSSYSPHPVPYACYPRTSLITIYSKGRTFVTHSFTFARLAPAIFGLTTLLALGLSSPSAHAQSYTEQTLYSFTGSDGIFPEGNLTDIGGTLYGTTYGGGSNGAGTVFSINADGTNEQILYSFAANGVDGFNPSAGLTDVGGTLYGTTYEGGTNNDGTVFSIDSTGNKHTLLNFNGSNGAYPLASLTDVGGTLYGTTPFGGTSDRGTVFSIDTSGNEHTLYNFTGTSGDGIFPEGNLTDIGGTFYGTTSQGGGADNGGTVFSINADGTNEQTLYSFTGTGVDGFNPSAGLTDVGGTLYGTTQEGGSSGQGTVFSIDTSGNEHTLFSFNFADGDEPVAGLTDVGGTLYGTTYRGGTNGGGTVFSIDTDGTNEQTLYNFTGTGGDGVFPAASLIDVGGTLYGTTYEGGTNNDGTVFSLTPNSVATPEPASWATFLLGGLGLLGLTVKARRRA